MDDNKKLGIRAIKKQRIKNLTTSLFSKSLCMTINFTFIQQIEVYKNYLLSETHPNYKRIRKVIKKLITANSDIKSMRETDWTLSVINKSSADISYAYALPV